MKKHELLAVILFFIATIGTICGIFGIEKYRRAKFYTVELIARAPDHGNWHPRNLTVPYGKEVKILIRNIDTVSHGFAIPDFEVGVDEIKAGNVKVVSFIPSRRGTFPFMCTMWCSERHLEMRGELRVE